MAKSLQLANGKNMPTVGLGTWLATNESELSQAIESSLEAGYRHFDTAFVYGNERILGQVLQKWISGGKVRRDELFIVTKLPISGIQPNKVNHFLKLSLANLGLDYVDLYLIHAPFGVKYVSDTELAPIKDGKVILDNSSTLEEVWSAMERQVEDGLAKSIGISNFEEEQISRILQVAKIRPANLQVELHAYFQQPTLRAFCKAEGISIAAYAPFSSPGRKGFYDQFGLNFQPTNLLEDPTVESIASKHRKTSSQILLRFLIQLGVAVLPKSTNAERIKQNFQVFDFELNSQEMENLRQLDKGYAGRTFNFEFLPGIEEHPEFPKSMKKI